MRANAVAAANYVVFARDHFMASSGQRKREIAHALGTRYLFFGKEKRIEVIVDPLLVDLVRYANDIKASFEPMGTGSEKQIGGSYGGASQYGGPYRIRTGHLFHAMEALYQMS